MRRLLVSLSAILAFTGCASFQEAYHTDQNFGNASEETFAQQIAYPERPYAGETPEGMAGITSEEVMDVHNRTYAAPPTELDLESIELFGSEGE